MKRTIVASIAVVVLIAAGCSTGATDTDEYIALEMELIESRVQLAEITAERDDLALANSTESGVNSTEAPPELVALIDDWEAALNQGDDSVLDLYLPKGYHLYGDQRFEYDQIVDHLTSGDVEQEWLTEPLLVAEDSDGRNVVVRGLRNTSPIWSNASALLFEIVTRPGDELRIVHTAWFYDNEW